MRSFWITQEGPRSPAAPDYSLAGPCVNLRRLRKAAQALGVDGWAGLGGRARSCWDQARAGSVWTGKWGWAGLGGWAGGGGGCPPGAGPESE